MANINEEWGVNHMKTITIEEYEAKTTHFQNKVMDEGDMLCVDCDSGRKFVIVEESQYQVMSNALKTVLAAPGMDDETYKAVMRAAKHAGVTGSYGRDI